MRKNKSKKNLYDDFIYAVLLLSISCNQSTDQVTGFEEISPNLYRSTEETGGNIRLNKEESIIALGLGGDDYIDLGPGDDYVYASFGNDHVYTRGGDDTIIVVGDTTGLLYTIDDIDENFRSFFPLSSLTENRSMTEVGESEIISGGSGEDTLIVFGSTRFTNSNLEGDIEKLIYHDNGLEQSIFMDAFTSFKQVDANQSELHFLGNVDHTYQDISMSDINFISPPSRVVMRGTFIVEVASLKELLEVENFIHIILPSASRTTQRRQLIFNINEEKIRKEIEEDENTVISFEQLVNNIITVNPQVGNLLILDFSKLLKLPYIKEELGYDYINSENILDISLDFLYENQIFFNDEVSTGIQSAPTGITDFSLALDYKQPLYSVADIVFYAYEVTDPSEIPQILNYSSYPASGVPLRLESYTRLLLYNGINEEETTPDSVRVGNINGRTFDSFYRNNFFINDFFSGIGNLQFPSVYLRRAGPNMFIDPSGTVSSRGFLPANFWDYESGVAKQMSFFVTDEFREFPITITSSRFFWIRAVFTNRYQNVDFFKIKILDRPESPEITFFNEDGSENLTHTYFVNEDEDLTFNVEIVDGDRDKVLSSFSYEDGDLELISSSSNIHTYTFTPDENYNGTVELFYQLTDDSQLENTTTGIFQIVVIPVEDEPELIKITQDTLLRDFTDLQANGILEVNAPDFAGDISYNIIDDPDYGSFVILESGEWFYTLNIDLSSATFVNQTITDSITVGTNFPLLSEVITVTINENNIASTNQEATFINVDEPELRTININGVDLSSTDFLNTEGRVSVEDSDGDAHKSFRVVEEQSTISSFGHFFVSIDPVIKSFALWTYRLDLSNDTVSNLSVGNSLQDSFVLTSLDGTTYTIDIEITNEVAEATSSLDTFESEIVFQLLGDDTDNFIEGSGKNEEIIGGLGSDTLFGGGGQDSFVYQSIEDSFINSHGQELIDLIEDFSITQGDKICFEFSFEAKNKITFFDSLPKEPFSFLENSNIAIIHLLDKTRIVFDTNSDSSYSNGEDLIIDFLGNLNITDSSDLFSSI